MKIFVDRKPVTGPWGGGNKTVAKLCERLQSDGHEVVHHLGHDDIDLLFCFDPRDNEYKEWYQDYFNYRNTFSVPLIQRVGDCGTHGKPKLTALVKNSVRASDFVIFPSEWAKKLIGFRGNNCAVIHNAPLAEFHKLKKGRTEALDKVRLVTHHWSPNPKKGYALYKKLDDYIKDREDISFTYIGQWPIAPLVNSEYYPPTGDNDFISEKMSECDIYLTASEEEAGANHVLEGMACGLPVVYHTNGGSIPEYCGDNGVGFEDFDQMIAAIQSVKQDYGRYKNNVLKYDESIENVIDKYVEIIYCTKLT